MMGQSQTTNNNTRMTYDCKVTGVSGSGEMTLEVALVGYAMNLSNPMSEMKYDSETDTSVPDFAKSMAATLKEVYTLTLSPLGAISNVQVPAGLAEKVQKILEEIAGNQMAMATAAGAGVSADAFKQAMEGFFMAFPEDGAQLKKPWEAETKINQMIAFNTKTKMELVKTGAETHEIKVSSQITQDPEAAPMEMEGMTISYHLMGTSDGNLVLDAGTGVVRSTESVTSISGDITVESSQLPEPMSIPMTIRSTEKITRK
jgi:hypothetical protein